MSRRQTIGKVARRAAAFIEENGWRQGDWLGADGSVCLRGAFNAVTVGHIAYSPGLAELEFAKWLGKFEDLLQDSSPNAGSNLINLAPWNDAKGRTQEEVLAYLHKFAEEYDPQPVLS